MSFNLSLVSIIPDYYYMELNQIAAAFGVGEYSFNVKLIDPDGRIYWGNHAWWKPSQYAYYMDEDVRAEVIDPTLLPTLDYLYERVSIDGNAQQNWQAALSELNLSLYPTE